MDSIFGGSREETQADPTLQALNQFRLQLLQQLAAGTMPPMLEQYMNKIVVPSTTANLTAGGLGRSGAVGEATANAMLQGGTQLFMALLGGGPQSGSRTTTTHKVPGIFDFVGLLDPIGKSVDWLSKIFKEDTSGGTDWPGMFGG